MSCLASINYDPAVVAAVSTNVVRAMAALNTTSLRLGFTVPLSGKVMVRMQGVVHGAATVPQMLWGVMDTSTVVARIAPKINSANLSASALVVGEAMFVVAGLTPESALTWDAAVGVETAVSSSAIKYGGPNTSTANNAFGGFSFEVWGV